MSEPRYWIEREGDMFVLMERPDGWENAYSRQRYVRRDLETIDYLIAQHEREAAAMRAALSAWKAEQQEGTSGNGNEP